MGFRFEFVDAFRIIMLHGKAAPPAPGWRDYLLELRNRDVKCMGLLVFTNGGAPDPAQRQELNQVLNGRHFSRAIVHRSAMVRGVVAAVSWFAPGVKAFSPCSWSAAAEHAGFQPDELSSLASHVRRLHAEMVNPIPWLDAALDPPCSGAPSGDPVSASTERHAAPMVASLRPVRAALGALKSG